MRNNLLYLFVLLIMPFAFYQEMYGQAVIVPATDFGIYQFLDEMASEGITGINSAVKPYTRRQVAEKLLNVYLVKEKLNSRQQKELLFFIKTFSVETAEIARSKGITTTEVIFNGIKDSRLVFSLNPAAAIWHDTLFTITARPILGTSIGTNSKGNCITWRNGAEIYGSAGRWGFNAALRDNHQDPLLSRPIFLTQQTAGHIKGRTDWSEMTGGITYSWKWGYLGFMKESPVWGTNYAGANIFSGRAPSFMQVKLYVKPVKWLEMTWIHGWLNSMVVDSTRSFWVTNAYGTDYRELYHRKYIAASMFTVTPMKGLNISAGNSVIWSDPRLTPYYLMPLFFYKSVDHGINSGIDNSNSQMFIDISSRQIRHLHIYGTLFIDEMSVKRFTSSDYNFFSWKGGMRAGNFSPVRNLWITAECTFTYPLAYQHYVPVLTFENQGFNLGHYLRDNTREWYFALDYKPIRAMNIRLYHNRAERGEDFNSKGGSRTGLPYINPVVWKSIRTGAEVTWQVAGGVYFNCSFVNSDVTGEDSWTPVWLYDKKNTFSAGVTWGF